MDKPREPIAHYLEYILPWLVLAILLLYTYIKFLEHPYIGFRINGEGEVYALFVKPTADLRVGDRLVRIHSTNWEELHSDLTRPLFGKVEAGQPIDFKIDRNGERFDLTWLAPGFNRAEALDLLISEGWLAFFFWGAGTFTLLTIRPCDRRWRLLIAFNYLTALWLAFGSGPSFYHLWGSAILLRSSIWFCIPVYLRLHWYFPRPLGKLPIPVSAAGYGLASALAVAELFRVLPPRSFYLGFAVAAAGSLLLVSLHAWLQPETRRDLRLLFIIILAALVPSLVVGLIRGIPNPALNSLPNQFDTLALLSFPLLPLAYFYAVYRRRLGNLELRVNRIISLYFFIVLLGVILLPVIALAALRNTTVGGTILIGALTALTTSLTASWGYPHFEQFLERRLYGISVPANRLQEILSIQLTASTSLDDLIRFIKDKVLTSLFVRQFVFIQLRNGDSKTLIQIGVKDEEVPNNGEMPAWLSSAGTYLPPQDVEETPAGPQSPTDKAWIRLVLPLRIEDQTIGAWLFGRRDPDDFYSQRELPVLKSLADQTAIAFSHMLQAGRLQTIYKANIDRNEEERRALARDLHDSILNALAALSMRLEATALPAGYQEAFEEVIRRTRDIASGLRPPMLDYGGLKPAIEGLAEHLMQRSKEPLQIIVNTEGEAGRYPAEIELHVFRIVQEACENAHRHGHSKTITINGALEGNRIELTITDDGSGFIPVLKLEELLANKHYGLAGMIERAILIGGEVRIESAPQAGTRVYVKWIQKARVI